MFTVSYLAPSLSIRFDNNIAFNSNIKHWEPKSMQLFQKMFFNATSFNQKLCWKLNKDQPVKSFQVFCFTEGGKFDPHCVDEDVLVNANRRCEDPIDSYFKSWTDFLEEVQDAFADICEFFQDCFPFLGNVTCFAPDAMTPVEFRGMVAMKDLQLGDRVLTASGDYQPVYSMFHSDKSKPTPYLQIHTTHSQNNTQVRPLELTPNHMLHVVGYDNPIPAWQVQRGDYLYVLEARSQDYSGRESMSLATRQSQWKQSQVIEIREIVRNGLYNPLTPDGTIIVDGIATSAYASFLGTEHIQLFRRASDASIATAAEVDDTDEGLKVISHQTFIHMLLSPYRAMCLYVPLPLCGTSNSSTDGGEDKEESEWYGRLGQKVLLIWLRQHVVAQAIIFLFLVTFFGFLNMILNPLGLSVVMTFFGSSFLYRSTSFLAEEPSSKKEKTC